MLKGNEHHVADVGKYNAGQKMMFWTIMSMIEGRVSQRLARKHHPRWYRKLRLTQLNHHLKRHTLPLR